jgi:hypothetical protein
MKINEVLNDDQLYEIWWLLSDAIWEALVEKYVANDIDEGYVYRRPFARRRNPMPTRSGSARTLKRKPALKMPVKPFPIRSEKASVNKTKIPPSQTSGINPKIDIQNGPDFKLKDRYVMPELSDKDIEIEMKKKPNGRR